MVRRASEAALFAVICRRLALLCWALGACSGCGHTPRQRAAPASSARVLSSASSASSSVSAAMLAPLASSGWLVDLQVDGFDSAALAVPIGAREPRPVVIALHGSADRPEWSCGAFRGVAGPAPFVLCPRGVLRRDFPASDLRYTFSSADDAARELRAGLTALKRRFGSYVAPGPVVFAGFGIGADDVAWIARQEPAFFSRIMLVAPAQDSWASSLAALFGRQGGQRVLFACGPPCRDEAELKAVLTRRGGAEARTVFLGDRPAALDGATVSLLASVWPWLLSPPAKPTVPENLAGNPLPAGRPPERSPGL